MVHCSVFCIYIILLYLSLVWSKIVCLFWKKKYLQKKKKKKLKKKKKKNVAEASQIKVESLLEGLLEFVDFITGG